MTALEPRIRSIETSPCDVQTVEPVRLQYWPKRRRHPLHEFADFFAVRLNRLIGDHGWAKRIYWQALRQTEYSEVRMPVGDRPGLHGLRIAFLTDLHLGSYLDADALDLVLGEVALRRPDIVCFGGDLINTRASELDILDRPLRLLRPRFGFFAVPGNHDHHWHHDMGSWQDQLEALGVTVLNNHGVRIERGCDSFWLAGVDDLTDCRPDIRRALWGRDEGEPTVLLAHQPDHFLEAAKHRVDLTLSGHTHGGQVRIRGWAPISHTRHGYTAGRFRDGDSELYVSRGVGATILPLRVGARAEVPIVRCVAE